MPDWGTDDSSGTLTPDEQSQANKRALQLGLIAAGLGLMQAHRNWGESRGQAVARSIGEAGTTGLNAYLGGEQAAQQGALERQKMLLQQAQTAAEMRRADAEAAQTGLNLRRSQPVGRDPFARFRGTNAERFFPDPETSSQLSVEEIPKVYTEGVSAYQKSLEAEGQGYHQETKPGADGTMHHLVYDKTGKVVSDTPLSGIPANTKAETPKTIKLTKLDKDGRRWEVLYDLKTRKPIDVGPVSSGSESYRTMGGLPFISSTVPTPPKSSFPDLSEGEASAATGEAPEASTPPPVGSSAPPADLPNPKRGKLNGKLGWAGSDGRFVPDGEGGTAATPTPATTPKPEKTPDKVVPKGTLKPLTGKGGRPLYSKARNADIYEDETGHRFTMIPGGPPIPYP